MSITTVLAAPTVSNVTFTQRAGTRLVDVTYNLAVAGANPTVALAVSSDAGATFVGANGIRSLERWARGSAGSGKLITRDAVTDWPGNLCSSVQVRVPARALTLAGAPFVPIAGGSMNSF